MIGRLRRTSGARTAAAPARIALVATATAILAAAVAGCGYDVQLPDLFLVTRTGQGSRLTLVVNDSGAVTCDAKHKTLSSSQLITARDLADNLSTDASHKLTIRPVPGTVYTYRVKLQQGTISFPDRAAAGHRYLPQLELFVAQVAQTPCGLTG